MRSTNYDETWHLIERRRPGLKLKAPTPPVHLVVNGEAVGRVQNDVTVSDLSAGTVEYITGERRQVSLDRYFERLSTDQLGGIETVWMCAFRSFRTLSPEFSYTP